MTDTIDVLIIDPSDDDAKKTIAAIRRKAPKVSTLRVKSADQAAQLMFERGLFTERPQVPRLIVIDLVAAGEGGAATLRRLKNYANVPVIIFSATRTSKDILNSYLLGAQMNFLKPADANEYGAAIERVVGMWLAGCFTQAALKAG